MKVLVTGGSGRLGRLAIAELLDYGYEVVNAGRRRASDDGPPTSFVETDLTDVGQVAGLLRDCDALVHLGAIPFPWSHPDEVVFASSASDYGRAWSKAS